jgi:methyl-accepting chemotaxis protein
MGQIADSLRSIVQTMKDGDEIFKQNLNEIEEAAKNLSEAAEGLTKASTELIDDLEEENDEPSDYEMMSAFGTKWHDGL